MEQNIQGFDEVIRFVQNVRACCRFFIEKKNISMPRGFEIYPDSFDSESEPILTNKVSSKWLYLQILILRKK